MTLHDEANAETKRLRQLDETPTKPQGNKAQHSPLPWEIGDSVENPRGMAPFTAIVNRHKRKHGRTLNGERHHQAKLTQEQVDWIRASSFSSKDLARWYGVTYRAIWAIRTGRSWY